MKSVYICLIEHAESLGRINTSIIKASEDKNGLLDKVRQQIRLSNSSANEEEIIQSLNMAGFAEYDDFENSSFTYHILEVEL